MPAKPAKIHMLVTDEMLPVPINIKVIENWGYLSIVIGNREDSASGLHMILESDEAAFKEWFLKFKKVWIGKGQPMMQRFESLTFDLN